MTQADFQAMDESTLRAIYFGRTTKCPSERTWVYDALLAKAVARRKAEDAAMTYFV